MARCPSCFSKLNKLVVAGVELDICKDGCGGIWFDRFELDKILKLNKTSETSVIDEYSEKQTVFLRTLKLKCIRCEDLILNSHYYSKVKQIKVDECPGCASIWLDSGEITKIREEFDVKKEFKKQADIESAKRQNTQYKPNDIEWSTMATAVVTFLGH